MRQAVIDAFPAFSAKLEGKVPWMYLDVENLVTTGVGNLIDRASPPLVPPSLLARRLPWQKPDGSLANPAEVALAYSLVKERTDLAQHGGGAFAVVTNLRISQAAIDALVDERAGEMEATLRRRFSSWDDLCADAQLGVMSMAWAMGENFDYPKFEADLAVEDFALYSTPEDPAEVPTLTGGCAFECYIPDAKNPGLVPRNAMNRAMFAVAQRVKDQGLDPAVLHYLDA